MNTGCLVILSLIVVFVFGFCITYGMQLLGPFWGTIGGLIVAVIITDLLIKLVGEMSR